MDNIINRIHIDKKIRKNSRFKHNYFYDLSEDLQEKILDIRDNNSAKKIQKIWNSYQAKFDALIKLSYKCYYGFDQDENLDEITIINLIKSTNIYIFIASSTSANIIEFIDKKIKKTDRTLLFTSTKWNELFRDIYDGLRFEKNISIEDPDIIYYNRTYTAFYNILTTLDIKWVFDYELEYFI